MEYQRALLGMLLPLFFNYGKNTHTLIFFFPLLQIQVIPLHKRLLPAKIQIKPHQVCIPIWPLDFSYPNNVNGARKLSALNPVG